MKFLRPLLETALVLWAVLGLGRWVLGWLQKRRTAYHPTAARQLRLLTWPLLAVGTGLAAAGPGLLAATAYERWLGAGLLAAVVALALPALALHARYWALNGATTLVFEPRQSQLHLYAGPQLLYDLARHGWPAQAEWVRSRWRGVFWRPYEYLRLRLPDGRALVVTSLLLDLAPLAAWLQRAGVPVREQPRGWAWV